MLEKKYLGVEIKLTDDGYVLHRAMLIVQRKSKASIKWSQDISSFDELYHIKTAEVIIGISGKGVLIKNTNQFITSINEALNTTLPSSAITDFFVQKITTPNGSCIAIVRNEKINNILNDFTKNGFFVTEIMIAPFSVKYIEILFSANESYKINLDDYEINVSLRKVISVEKSTKIIDSNAQMTIGGFTLPNKYVLAFSLAFSKIIGENESVLTSEQPSLSIQKSQFKYRNNIINAAIRTSIFILTILLFNLFANLALQSRIDKQEPLVIQYANQIKEKQQLKEQLDFIENTYGKNSFGNSKASFYADRIAASMPSNIQLEELRINPFYNEREKDSLHFVNNTIIMCGKVRNANELNTWLSELNKNSWCKKIIEQSFEQEINKNSGKFKVKLDVQ